MQKYIIITGGELRNKGAQSMTFITVDQMARRFPDCRCVLLSRLDYERTEEEKSIYNFDILSVIGVIKTFTLASPFGKKMYKKDPMYRKYLEILENAEAVIDISGYLLGSDWGSFAAVRHMSKVLLANSFKIPIYFMPQSYGPFDFKGKYSFLANYMIKHYMPRATVFAREFDGKKKLEEKYGLKNIQKSVDLVLQTKSFDEKNVFLTSRNKFECDIPKGSIAIIPNGKNNKYGEETKVLELYKSIIELARKKEKSVFLIYHAVEDLEICNKIKNSLFPDDMNVCVIENELNCLDFSNIVGSFDFVIASRYHSIVHSYKENVPAIVLGWAVKYKELTECFEQDKYCFDVQDIKSFSKIVDAVSIMCETYKEESEKIKTNLIKYQDNNVFDFIEIKSNIERNKNG